LSLDLENTPCPKKIGPPTDGDDLSKPNRFAKFFHIGNKSKL